MDWEVVWTEPAVADAEQIVRTVAGHSPTGAESLRADLFASVEVLARFPLIGPAYERDRTGRTREIRHGSGIPFPGGTAVARQGAACCASLPATSGGAWPAPRAGLSCCGLTPCARDTESRGHLATCGRETACGRVRAGPLRVAASARTLGAPPPFEPCRRRHGLLTTHH
jgi:plasmid stabilization system protein ParE